MYALKHAYIHACTHTGFRRQANPFTTSQCARKCEATHDIFWISTQEWCIVICYLFVSRKVLNVKIYALLFREIRQWINVMYFVSSVEANITMTLLSCASHWSYFTGHILAVCHLPNVQYGNKGHTGSRRDILVYTHANISLQMVAFEDKEKEKDTT